MSDTWVLTPCPRPRLAELRTLLGDLAHPRDQVVIVTTLPDPIDFADIDDLAATVLLFDKPGMWFSAWINLGLDHIYERTDATEILCIGSDAGGHAKSVEKLRAGLRQHDLVMAGPDWHNLSAGADHVRFGVTDKRTLWHRVPGACFMLAAEHRLRMDETFRWWYSDDDLEMRARQIGHVGLIPGAGLVHEQDHPLNAEQTLHAAQDRQRFVDKYGVEPW